MAHGTTFDQAAAWSGYTPFPEIVSRDDYMTRIEVPLIVACLRVPRHSRILEVGCGNGSALLAFAERCAPSRLAGLDIDPRLLDTAAQGVAAAGCIAELHLADVRQMPFADESFDVVVDFGTCYHIAHPERALAEIARVLAPGGMLVHETRLAQLLAHPVRSMGRMLPWDDARQLRPDRSALLFASRVKRVAA